MSIFYNDTSLGKIHMKELLTVYVECSQPLLIKELEMEADPPNIHWG